MVDDQFGIIDGQPVYIFAHKGLFLSPSVKVIRILITNMYTLVERFDLEIFTFSSGWALKFR